MDHAVIEDTKRPYCKHEGGDIEIASTALVLIYKMNETLYDRSFMTILVEMAVLKECTVCGRTFANKSNLNRHHASVHMKKRKKINVHEGVNLKKMTKHGLHIQTLNKVLWNIVLHLIENRQLGTRLTTRPK